MEKNHLCPFLNVVSCRYRPGKNRWRFYSSRNWHDFFYRILPGLKIVIIGCTASGKSTLGGMLVDHGAKCFNAAQIVKNYINGSKKLEGNPYWQQFRHHAGHLPPKETDLKFYLEKLRRNGELWPPAVCAALVFQQLLKAKSGWLLDGFPRSAEGAELLLENFKPDAVIFMDVPPGVSEKRSLSRKKDTDERDVVRNKIHLFEKHKDELLMTFQDKDLLIPIDAAVEPGEVLTRAKVGLIKQLKRRFLEKTISSGDFTKPRTHFMSSADTGGMPGDRVRKLILAGANVFRFNFSFIKTKAQRKKTVDLLGIIRAVSREEKLPVGCAADLPGPSIRIGPLEKPMALQEGEVVFIKESGSAQPDKIIPVYIPHLRANLIECLGAASREKKDNLPLQVLVDHGQVLLEIEEIKGEYVVARAKQKGLIKSQKGVSFPQIHFHYPAITAVDKENLTFALAHHFDYIVQSFVKHPHDIIRLRELLEKSGKVLPIIVKIETREAIDEENLDPIAKEADALMIARGHLADETGARYLVPIWQDRIDYYARRWGKPVILATEVYSSMMKETLPNRADADNVYRAIRDSIDMIMLSGAEAVLTPHPVLVMKTIAAQALATESTLKTNELFRLMLERRRGWFVHHFQKEILPSINNPALKEEEIKQFAFSQEVVRFVERENIDTVAITSNNIKFPKYISRLNPHLKLIVITSNEKMVKELLLYGGVFPVLTAVVRSEDYHFGRLYAFIDDYKLIAKGEKILALEGLDNDLTGATRKIYILRKMD